VFQVRAALAAGAALPAAPDALGVPDELDPAHGPVRRRRGAAA
jgi:hypothetical protein